MDPDDAPPSAGFIRLSLTALNAAIPVLIFSVTRLSIVIAAGTAMGLTPAEMTAMIIALYAIPGLLGLILTTLYRQPLMLGWSTPGVIFLASLGNQVPYAEVLGAVAVAGGVVTILGLLGLTARLTKFIPSPIVFGVLAGLVLPFVVRLFNDFRDYPWLIGGVLVSFLIARRLLEPRIPALVVALVVGVIGAAISGGINVETMVWTLPSPSIMVPAFSVSAMITIVPVIVVLITLQGNMPSVVYLEAQKFRPSGRVIDAVSGIGTSIGSVLGPAPMSLASMIMPLLAGPSAGPHATRHWAVYVSSAGLVIIALLAPIAADLPTVLPVSLLLALAGLALLPTLGQALTAITSGPLRLGPLFAFVVAVSEMTLFGFGSVLWALIIGIAVSAWLETDGLRASLQR
jgi:benzoate membrane transport protein